MRSAICCTRLLLFVVGTASCGPSLAGVDEGVAALQKADYAAALKEFEPLAARGDSEAQYRLGRMYEFGRGVLVNMPQALIWLRKSAAQENASARSTRRATEAYRRTTRRRWRGFNRRQARATPRRSTTWA
jgi:TPR repeat protein